MRCLRRPRTSRGEQARCECGCACVQLVHSAILSYAPPTTSCYTPHSPTSAGACTSQPTHAPPIPCPARAGPASRGACAGGGQWRRARRRGRAAARLGCGGRGGGRGAAAAAGLAAACGRRGRGRAPAGPGLAPRAGRAPLARPPPRRGALPGLGAAAASECSAALVHEQAAGRALLPQTNNIHMLVCGRGHAPGAPPADAPEELVRCVPVGDSGS